MWLSEIFTIKELEEKTRNLYLACKKNINDMPLFFEDYFGISYKLAFGEEKPKNSIYELLNNYYKNEFYVKEAFTNKYLKNHSVIYEYPIENSRADIVEINDSLRCYEIKTKYDNLDRLEKQISDYSKVFEYISIVCSIEKYEDINKIVPNYCGIITYRNRRNNRFSEIRKPLKTNIYKIENVLKTFNKKELYQHFNTNNIDDIVRENGEKELLNICKNIIKNKSLVH